MVKLEDLTELVLQLAYLDIGGEILKIESAVMPVKGKM